LSNGRQGCANYLALAACFLFFRNCVQIAGLAEQLVQLRLQWRQLTANNLLNFFKADFLIGVRGSAVPALDDWPLEALAEVLGRA